MYLRLFKELSSSDVSIAGGKGASLGELTQAGFDVPPGFVILTNVFVSFFEAHDLFDEINQIKDQIDFESIEMIESSSNKIVDLIINQELNLDLVENIYKYFDGLGAQYVAVRSSATLEDSNSDAWAGQLDSFLNTGRNDLIDNVKKCWASLFSPRALTYRFRKGLLDEDVAVAVVVQRMVESEKSGVAFSTNPVSGDCDQILIDAGYGLGEAIVSGAITPDSYIVSKDNLNSVKITLNSQRKALYRGEDSGNEWRMLSDDFKQVLSIEQIRELSMLILKIEDYYGYACDIEWAVENERFYLTQVRPITTLDLKKSNVDASVIISKFLSDTELEDVFKMSFEFIPLFWTLPVYFLRDDMHLQFAPVLTLKNDQESHLFIDSKYIFGQAKLLLKKHLRSKELFLHELKNDYLNQAKVVDQLYNDLFSHKLANENDLRQFLVRVVDVWKGFFGICSLAYIDHDSIFEIIDEFGKLNLSKLDRIMKVHKHKSFELLNEEVLMEFKDCESINYNFLMFILTSYSFVPMEKDIENVIKDMDWVQLRDRIKLKVNETQTEAIEFDKQYKNLNQLEKKFIDFIEFIKFIREHRKQYFSKVFYCLYQTSKRLLESWGVDDLDPGLVFSYELLLGKDFIIKNKNQILKRSEGFAFYNNGEAQFFHNTFNGYLSNDLEDFKRVLSRVHTNNIRGVVAFRGRVKSKVVVAIKNADFLKIKHGDILVTSMTRPEVLPYLGKVSGIITDEGGVTCHAAIIARELEIPCIIGTKIATTVLKNGDLVELDALNGRVFVENSEE